MPTMWMIRAGRGSEYFSDFQERKVVFLGWKNVGDLRKVSDRAAVVSSLRQHYPEYKPGKALLCAGTLYKFSKVISKGDEILSYDSSSRTYIIGEVTGPYYFNADDQMPHVIPVEWKYEFSRDTLSLSTKHAVGSISAMFKVAEHAQEEILARAQGKKYTPQIEEEIVEEEVDDEYQLADIQLRAKELIKDKINELDWDELQRLVAGLLRAMGYKTRISPPGADRGKDIIASPDGFGFENPRIVVEVKHRDQTMGGPEIRSFLGGRHQNDKLLYVSTGGFTKDAMYEADRASIPLTLMDLDSLVDGLLEHYEKIDMETRAMVPLVKVWWVG